MNYPIWRSICRRLLPSKDISDLNKNRYNSKIIVRNYNDRNEFNGLFKYLTEKTGGNIHDNHTITVSSNSIQQNDLLGTHHPKFLLEPENKNQDYLAQNGKFDAWVCFDFKNMKIQVTSYSIRSSQKQIGHIKNWVIEVSNDGTNWSVIDERNNCPDLNGPNKTKNYSVQPNQFSRYCRFRHTGEIWSGQIELNAIEFYGSLKFSK